MPAANYPLVIEQYSNTELLLFYTDPAGKPIDLTGYSARAQARTPSGQLVLELTTANKSIILGAEAGTISLVFTEDNTADPLLLGASYDLMLIPPNEKGYRLLEGRVVFSKGQTHD